MEKALLPVFDPQQNTELFNEKVDLSKYILIATSFSYDISQISSPLISRLDFINVEEIKTKKFFLDENFFSVLFVSLLIGLITLYIIAFDSSRFEVEKITNKHKNEQ